jgi:hypothetical protein
MVRFWGRGERRGRRWASMLAGVGVGEHARGWPCGWVGTTRRGMVGRRATTLMYAGWDRRSAIRRKVPLTRNAAGQAGAHRTDGDRSCDGGAPARRTDQLTTSADRRQVSWHRGGSGGHLGPQEPGELAGDGCDHHVVGGLTDGQAAEPAAEAQLGCPRPRDHLRVQALVAAGDLGAYPWPVLVGPGRLDPAGRAGGRCRPW